MTQDIAAEAENVADEIAEVCAGRNTIAVYIALSMVLGRSAARAKRPDFDGMMRLVGDTAKHHFEHARPN